MALNSFEDPTNDPQETTGSFLDAPDKETEKATLHKSFLDAPDAVVQTAPKQNETGWQDLGTKLHQGVIGLGEAASGIAGLAGFRTEGLSRDLEQRREELQQELSPEQQKAEAATQNAKGFGDTVKAYIDNPRAIGGSIAESLPGTVAGLGPSAIVARGIANKAFSETMKSLSKDVAAGSLSRQEAVALARQAGTNAIKSADSMTLIAPGAIAEGVQTSGDVASTAQAQGRTHGEYAVPAVAAGALTTGVDLVSGKLFGDVGTDVVTGANTVKAKTHLGRLGKEGLTESGEEGVQSPQERVNTNIALGKQDIFEGVGNAAAGGIITGGVMGLGFGSGNVVSAAKELIGGNKPDAGIATRAASSSLDSGVADPNAVIAGATDTAQFPPDAGVAGKVASSAPRPSPPASETPAQPTETKPTETQPSAPAQEPVQEEIVPESGNLVADATPNPDIEGATTYTVQHGAETQAQNTRSEFVDRVSKFTNTDLFKIVNAPDADTNSDLFKIAQATMEFRRSVKNKETLDNIATTLSENGTLSKDNEGKISRMAKAYNVPNLLDKGEEGVARTVGYLQQQIQASFDRVAEVYGVFGTQQEPVSTPQTETSVQPTETSVQPTETSVQPTETSVQPTETQKAPVTEDTPIDWAVQNFASTAVGNNVEGRLDPTQNQKANTFFQDLPIAIENAKGSVRRHSDGITVMPYHYGEIPGTKGRDGDPVDVIIPEGLTHDQINNAKKAYVIDQVDKDGYFDEHKIVLGVGSANDAENTYVTGYSEDWKGGHSVTEIPIDRLREWLKDPEATQLPLNKNIPLKPVETTDDQSQNTTTQEEQKEEIAPENPTVETPQAEQNIEDLQAPFLKVLDEALAGVQDSVERDSLTSLKEQLTNNPAYIKGLANAWEKKNASSAAGLDKAVPKDQYSAKFISDFFLNLPYDTTRKDNVADKLVEIFKSGKAAFSLPKEQVQNAFKTPEEAQQHLVEHFGKGIQRLLFQNIISFDPPPASINTPTANGAEAVYYGGKAYLNLNNISKERLVSVVIHEIGEHYGLERMIGSVNYRNLQNQIRNRAKIQGSAAYEAWNYVKTTYEGEVEEGSEDFISEVIAVLGERTPNAPWYRRLLSQLKAFLVRTGIGRGFLIGQLNEGDLHDLLYASLKRAMNGEAREYHGRMQPAYSNTAPNSVGEALVNFIKGVAEDQRSFAFGKSSATDIADVIQDVNTTDLTIEYAEIGRNILLTVEGENGGFYIRNPNSDTPHINAQKTPRVKDVDTGSLLYQIALTWALNNNKTIIPDPGGLSAINQLRRSVQMLSTGLRYGTFKHILPAQEQLDDGLNMGDTFESGVNGLLQYISKTVSTYAPETKNIGYDFNKNTFFDRKTGSYLLDYQIAEISRKTPAAVERGIGLATAKISILTQQIANGEVSGPLGEEDVGHGLASALYRSRGVAFAESQANTDGKPLLKSKVSPRYSFLGQKAATADLGSRALAEHMIANGEKPDVVRQVTDWFIGDDGQWRFEIDSSKASLKIPFDQVKTPLQMLFNSYKVVDVLDYPQLYEAYPFIKDIKFTKQAASNDSNKRVNGWFSALDNTVNVTPYAVDPTSTMLHELQHVIQQYEGFAVGGSIESIFKTLEKVGLDPFFQDAILANEAKAEELRKEYVVTYSILNNPDLLVKLNALTNLSAQSLQGLAVKDPDLRMAFEELGLRHAKEAQNFKVTIDAKLGAGNYDLPSYVLGSKKLSERDLQAVASQARSEYAEYKKAITALKSGDKAALEKYMKDSKKLFEAYKRLSGEVEARNVENRRLMTEAQRRAVSPNRTKDTPRSQHILKTAADDVTEADSYSLEELEYSGLAPNGKVSPIGTRYSLNQNVPIFGQRVQDPSITESIRDLFTDQGLKDFREKATHGAYSNLEKFKSQRTAFLSVSNLVSAVKDVLPGLRHYQDLIDKRRAHIDELLHGMQQTIDRWSKAISATERAELNEVMQKSTLEDINASLPWAGVMDRSLNDKLFTEISGYDHFKASQNKNTAYIQASFSKRFEKKLAELAQAKGAIAFGANYATFGTEAEAVRFVQDLENLDREMVRTLNRDGNASRRVTHRDAEKRFNQLSPTAQAVYEAIYAQHDGVSKERFKALETRIKDAILDSKKQSAAIAGMRAVFESNQMKWYYVPLGRFGNFWFYAEMPNGKKWFQTFEHQQALEKGKAQFFEDNPNAIDLGSGERLDGLDKAVGSQASDAFLHDVMEILKTANLDKDALSQLQDEIYQRYLEQLPDVSMRHSAQHRQGVLGFEKDQLRSSAHALHHSANQIANMIYGSQMTDVLKESMSAVRISNSVVEREKAELYIQNSNALLKALRKYGTLDNVKIAVEDNKKRAIRNHMRSKRDATKTAEDVQAYRERIEEIKEFQAFINTFGDIDNADAHDAIEKRVAPIRNALEQAELLDKHPDKMALVNDVLNELVKTQKHITMPVTSDLDAMAQFLRGFSYIFTLGLSLSSAIVNLLQTVVVAIPVSIGEFNSLSRKEVIGTYNEVRELWWDSIKAWNGAKDADGNVSISETLRKKRDTTQDPLEYARYDRLIKALDVAKYNGDISRTMTWDLIGYGNEGELFGGTLQGISKVMGQPFHIAERMNREITFLANFMLEDKRTVAEGGQINTADLAATVAKARDLTRDAHGDYSPDSSARLFRGPVAAVALQFKKYPVMMYVLWGKNFLGWLHRNDWRDMPEDTEAEKVLKEQQKQTSIQATRTFTALLTAQVAFAGAFSVPLASTMLGAANIVINTSLAVLRAMLGKDDDDEDYDTEKFINTSVAQMFGETAATAVSKGLVNAMLNVNLSSRMDLSAVFFREPLEQLDGKELAQSYMAQSLGVAGGLAQNMFEGVALMHKGEVHRGIEALLPKFLKDPLKAERYFREGAQSKSGTVVKDMNVREVLLQGIGFSSADLDRIYTERGYAKKQEAFLTEKRQAIVSNISRSLLSKEKPDLEPLQEWNRVHPEWPITGASVRSSMKNTAKHRTASEGRGYDINPKLAYLYDRYRITD